MQVRDGKLQAPICPNCGCRLEEYEGNQWTHFWDDLKDSYDMRGCRCTHIDFTWTLKEGKLKVIYA